MSFSPEQFKELLENMKTASAYPDAILIFWGIITAILVLVAVWSIISYRLRPVEKLEGKIDDLIRAVAGLQASQWSETRLNQSIDFRAADAIREHEKNCPLRNKRNSAGE